MIKAFGCFFLFTQIVFLSCNQSSVADVDYQDNIPKRLISLKKCEALAESVRLQIKELESIFENDQSLLSPFQDRLAEVLKARKSILKDLFSEKLTRDSHTTIHEDQENVVLDDGFVWDAIRFSVRFDDHDSIATWFDLGGNINLKQIVEICLNASLHVLRKLFENSHFLDALYELDKQSPVLEHSHRLWGVDDAVLIKLLMEGGFTYPAPVKGRTLIHRLTAPMVNDVIDVDGRAEERYAAIKASLYRAKITGIDTLLDTADYATGLTPLQNMLEYFPGEGRSFEELLFDSSELTQLGAFELAVRKGRNDAIASLYEFGCERVREVIASKRQAKASPIAGTQRRANPLLSSNRGRN